jgi:hypothetical protein
MTIEDALREFLSRIERREAELLTWGAVDAGFTRGELESIALDTADDVTELAALGRAAAVDSLLDRGLLVRYRAGDKNLFRSRMAETVRLMARLRQWLRYHEDEWRRAPRLVADYRFVVRPRMRPRRELSPDAVVQRLRERIDVGDLRSRAVLAYLGGGTERPTELARFQYDATERLLAELDSGGGSGTVVTAGTGSGKTHAFYLPALVHVAEDMARHEDPALRVLALYPRQELLKDQLQAALAAARRVRPAMSGRGIRIGAWFGLVPWNDQRIARQWHGSGGARLCPYLSCPSCGSDMAWRRDQPDDVALTCTSTGCGDTVGRDEFALTREDMRGAPPDVLFTTTESLNRQLASGWARAVFGLSGTRRPRLCLLDEIHTYDGTHGAQVANLVRRWRHAVGAPVAFVGLSATLANAEQFLADVVGLPESSVVRIAPAPEQLERTSDEYLLALRHDPTSGTQQLSLTIQACMLLPRMLDAPGAPVSRGTYGSKTFVFGDRLDSVNALYWQVLDAEGWWRPGRPRVGYSPHALATLRREDTGPFDVDRDRAGQTWAVAQALGHDLAGDRQLSVGRTTSQDQGVERNAQLVVATSALEVGFDDDEVGAVIQHKAPYEAATFLQRQGRAGRRPEMRPWTVVVLGDLGRDRLAYQGYDRLFDPSLDARRLPYRNAYVLKMQAVYATLDWVALRLRSNVWSDLAGPAENDAARRERQHTAARVLTDVVAGGGARNDLERHLRAALRLTDDELTVATWTPPRSLYLEALPTLIRRLESGWRVATGGTEPAASHPAPEFVPASLFADLLVPELEVTIPAFRGRERAPEALGLEQALREFAPGNATRRYAVGDREEFHWVPAPAPDDPVETIDVEALYACRDDGAVATDTGPVRCLRPVAVTLQQPPPDHSQYDRGELAWRVAIEPRPGGGTGLPVEGARLANVVGAARAHLHRDGAPVLVRRYAPAVTTTTNTRTTRTIQTRSFVDTNGAPAAIGFSHEVDALELDVLVPRERAAELLRDPLQLAEFRWSHLVARFEDADGFDPAVGIFDRRQLRVALLCALAEEHHAGEPTLQPAFDRLSATLGAALRGVLDVVYRATPDDDGSHDDPGRSLARLREFVDNEANVRAVADRARVLWEPPDDAALRWLRRRVAVTVAGLVVRAAMVLAPDLDAAGVAVDVVEVGDQLTAWVSEVAPGSTGFVEKLAALWQRDRRTFAAVAEAGTAPEDLQLADAQLLAVLRGAVQPDSTIAGALAALRSAWTAGHDASAQAARRLRDVLEQAGLRLRRSALVGVTSRIGAPGSDAATDAMYLQYVTDWDALAAATGTAIDSRVAAYTASVDPAYGTHTAPGSSGRGDRYSLLSALVWPRGPELAATALEIPNRFTPAPAPATTAVEALLGPDRATPVDLDDPDWRAAADAALRATGEASIEVGAAELPRLREAILAFTETPTDCGYVLSYPRVESITVGATTARLRVTVPEYL